jgi:hypothetical protein
VKQRALQDAHLMVMARELVVDVRETNLDTMATELVEREKQLAKTQLQELVRHGESGTS